MNDNAQPPPPDGLQDPPAAAPLPADPLPADPLPAAHGVEVEVQNVALPHPPQEANLPVDDDDDDVIIPASQSSAAGAAFAAKISNSAQQVMGNMFRGAIIHNPRYEFHFHFNKP